MEERGGGPIQKSAPSAPPNRVSSGCIKNAVELRCVKLGNSVSQLHDVTCHMRSNSVTFHPTQVSTPRLNPSQRVRYSI